MVRVSKSSWKYKQTNNYLVVHLHRRCCVCSTVNGRSDGPPLGAVVEHARFACHEGMPIITTWLGPVFHTSLLRRHHHHFCRVWLIDRIGKEFIVVAVAHYQPNQYNFHSFVVCEFCFLHLPICRRRFTWAFVLCASQLNAKSSGQTRLKKLSPWSFYNIVCLFEWSAKILKCLGTDEG